MIAHNDYDVVREFIDQEPLLAGFNNKHYDQFILKAILLKFPPEEVKRINDEIIVRGKQGWDLPELRDSYVKLLQYDLMDDTQTGTSLKSFEGHYGMNITESSVDFNVNRPLTEAEVQEMISYCKKDVDATDLLDDLRQDYLLNKIAVGAEAGLDVFESLSMTNAKLTAKVLRAERKKHDDERKYVYPDNLLKEWIPQEVMDFFNQMYDPSLTDEEVFSDKLEINIGECPVTISYGGIHGAIPNFIWKEGG